MNKIIILQSIKYYKGYTKHIKQPSAEIQLKIDRQSTLIDQIKNYDKKIKTIFTSYTFNTEQLSDIDIINRILYVQSNIAKLAKIPIFYGPHMNIRNSNLVLYLPVIGDDYTIQMEIFNFFVNLLNGFEVKNLKKQLIQFLDTFRKMGPVGENQPKFVHLANKRNIVYEQVSGNTFQFGYGKNSRLLRSTISDRTSAIAVAVARNKLVTKKLLKQAGLPVLDSHFVSSKTDALQVAKKLAYPIVVKPIDSDGGNGITAWIFDDKMLIRAYEKARKVSKNIVVEKHFEGNDYRLNMYNDVLYYASHRIPGGVIGDGNHTVKELVEFMNEERKEAIKNREYVKILEINDEMVEQLNIQNLSLDCIPGIDEFIRLRSTANITTGGTTVDIEKFSDIHKDNLLLVKRALDILRLDVSAVDFMSPDITKSWQEVGGTILEVNAKPQLISYKSLLYLFEKLLPNNGQIPTVIVAGEYDEKLVHKLSKKFEQENRSLGIVSREKLQINDSIVTKSVYNNLYDSTAVFMIDPKIEAMILFIDDLSYIRHQGYPLKEVDFVVVTESSNSSFRHAAQHIVDYFNTTTYVEESASNNEKFYSLLQRESSKSYIKSTIVKKIEDLFF